ncbi:MAG: amidohydrolase [Candidatus Caldarchaeum sp.]|nr:amidohydrolase [Candidatus Caldarchaeum sp.]
MAVKAFGFVNGRIYTSFVPLKTASSIVIFGDRIVYVGDVDKAMSLTSMLGGQLVDLDGLTMMPGFIDTHMHVDMLGMSLRSVDLRGVRSIEEMKKSVKEFYERNRSLSWIFGRGWDQELFEEKRWPNRHDLDEVIPDKPVFLERFCTHAAAANSRALELVKSRLDPEFDKYILKDEHGRATGIVVEDAVKVFRENIQFAEQDMALMMLDALKYAASLGVTTVGFVACSLYAFKLLQMLNQREGLPIRVRAYVNAESLNDLLNAGIRRSFGDASLKIMGIKIFSDGSLGAHTAWLSEPYQDFPVSRGTPTIEREKLVQLVHQAHRNGLQLAIHAIGDQAIDLVLDAYGRLGERLHQHRHRIEHASVLRRDQLQKLAELGLAVSVQPHFVISDWWVVKRLGEKRAGWIYTFKSMADRGVALGFSSDCPVEPLNPWETIYAAVSRGREEKLELYDYTSHEVFSTAEALHLHTQTSAYLLFEEQNLGTLEAGKYADFIVVDKDPMELGVQDLRNIKVLMTVVSGKIACVNKDYFDDLNISSVTIRKQG